MTTDTKAGTDLLLGRIHREIADSVDEELEIGVRCPAY
jgi:hypothetical protein